MPTESGPGEVEAPPRPASPPSYRRVLGQRSFAALWLAGLVSQSGDFVFEVAILWLVLQLTGSILSVTVLVGVFALPTVAVAPFIGVYVDRWDRRRMLLAVNLLQGVLVAGISGLVLSDHLSLALLLPIVFALSSGAILVRTASGAIVPQMVATDDLAPAMGLMSFSAPLNQILGLSVGGLVVAIAGPNLPIAFDAGTFFVAAALMTQIAAGHGRPPRDPDPARRPRGFRLEFAEGWRFIREHRFMLELIALGAVVNFFASALTALFAPYAQLILHGGATAYGLLGAGVAAGAVVGTLVVGKLDVRRSAGRYLFAGGIAIGASMAALGLVRSVPLALLTCVFVGVAISLTNLPILTLLQAKVPARLRGRVSATLVALIAATGPLGAFVAGPLALYVTIPILFDLTGAVIVASMATGYVLMTELRAVEY